MTAPRLNQYEQWEYHFTCRDCGRTEGYTQSELPEYRPPIDAYFGGADIKCPECGGTMKVYARKVVLV